MQINVTIKYKKEIKNLTEQTKVISEKIAEIDYIIL